MQTIKQPALRANMLSKMPSYHKRFTPIACTITGLALALIIALFYWLYSTSKDNILMSWSNKAQQTAQNVNYYMKMPMDAVAFSSLKVNEMLAQGLDHETVNHYLVNETAIYAKVIDENTTGVYCYYRGRYLDGSGWTPPKAYQPKERPWYKAALQGQGKIVLAKPYLNIQTEIMMTSVSQLLNDGESVVSMDIFLGGVQSAVYTIGREEEVAAALILDGEGFVVAHSDTDKIGIELGEHGSDLERTILQQFSQGQTLTKAREMKQEEKETTVQRLELNDSSGKKYTALLTKINSDWKVLFILDKDKMYASLVSIYLTSSLFLFLVLGTCLSVFLHMSRKYQEAEELSKEIQAVASIYVSAVKIDLASDSMTIIRSNPDIEELLGGDMANFSGRAKGLAEKFSSAHSRELMKQFMDPTTLEKRLSETYSISQEFVDNKDRWIRLRFVVVDRNASGALQHVLLAFENIDEDRKQQEALRKLSETDLMTGIRNRGNGEYLIRKAMAEGIKGMFCLMDADKFKLVNDRFGHATGDKVIIALAKSLSMTFRESDIVFRLGGDEFAVFSKGVVSEEIGRKIIDRLFKNIAKIDIPELHGETIAVSVGAAFFPADKQDTFESLYQRADNGTYQSKKVTGNSVTFVGPDEPPSPKPGL
ncbi:MAG: diguanylate cyclase [Desulfovibrio sp.]|nr:diguanylate cyclase [Desulfovibrio sp.]